MEVINIYLGVQKYRENLTTDPGFYTWVAFLAELTTRDCTFIDPSVWKGKRLVKRVSKYDNIVLA